MFKNGLWFIIVLAALNVASVLGYWPAVIAGLIIFVLVIGLLFFSLVVAGVHCVISRCWK